MKFPTRLLLPLLAFLFLTPVHGADFRPWKMADGRPSQTRMKVSSYDGTTLKLIREDNGAEITLDPAKLSAGDQAYLAALPKGASSSDWPMWRGPNRDARAPDTNLVKSFPDEGPPLLWQVEGLGKGFSSIAIAEGRIFTQGDKGGCRLVALDLKDGKEVWATKFGSGEPNGTPTFDDGMVYAIDREGQMTAVDSATGKEVWSKNFARDFGGRMMSGWGYSEGPLVDGDRIIVTPGGDEALMVALDKKSGDVIWKTRAGDLGNKGKPGAAYTGAVISQAAGVKQYVNLVGKAVVGVDAESGELLWHYGNVNNDTANIPTPLVNGNFVFASTGYGAGAALLEITGSGRNLSAREVYRLEGGTFQNHHGGMVMDGDHLYAGSGHNNGFPICLEWKTGKVVWGEERHSKGRESAALLWADGNLVFRYQNGIVAMVEASPDGYKEKGSFKSVFNEGQAWAHPVIHEGKLYLRSQDVLMCYDMKAR
jgi:outer membrane protein assembly factor BamB